MDTDGNAAQIGKRLDAIRLSFSDLTQQDWAVKHNFGKTAYNNWVCGVRRIPIDQAVRLCDTYGVDLDYIYRGRRDGMTAQAMKALDL